MIEEKSFGIIPLRKIKDRWQVLLIKHVSGFWAFPKGHKEEGESDWQAAVRELKEETNLTIEKRLFDETLQENYRYKRKGQPINKSVVYFIAAVAGDIVIQSKELFDGGFVDVDKADNIITFPEARRLLNKTRLMLQEQLLK